MRTKSPGSTKGIGIHHPFEAGRQADAEFMSISPAISNRCERCRDRRRIIHAADDDLVETDGAILVELGAHLVRRAAGGVAAHHVVAHQAIDLGPVLRGIGGRTAPPGRAWRRTGGCSRHDGRRAARSRSAGGSGRCPASPWRRAWCRRCRACGTAGRRAACRPRRGRPSRRAARSRPRSARRRSRGRRASACRAREAASTIGTLRAAVGQPPAGHPEDLALEIGHLAGQQRAADRDRLVERLTSGLVASRPAALRSAGAPTPRQRMTRPGYISSSVAAAMAMNTGCTE